MLREDVVMTTALTSLLFRKTLQWPQTLQDKIQNPCMTQQALQDLACPPSQTLLHHLATQKTVSFLNCCFTTLCCVVHSAEKTHFPPNVSALHIPLQHLHKLASPQVQLKCFSCASRINSIIKPFRTFTSLHFSLSWPIRIT